MPLMHGRRRRRLANFGQPGSTSPAAAIPQSAEAKGKAVQTQRSPGSISLQKGHTKEQGSFAVNVIRCGSSRGAAHAVPLTGAVLSHGSVAADGGSTQQAARRLLQTRQYVDSMQPPPPMSVLDEATPQARFPPPAVPVPSKQALSTDSEQAVFSELQSPLPEGALLPPAALAPSAANDTQRVAYRLNVAGYPADADREMWAAFCDNIVFFPRDVVLVQHDCNTYSGMSGSPLWRYQGGTSRSICGVHKADALVRGVDNLAVPLYQQAVAFIDAAVAGSRVLPSSSPAESATPSFEEAAAKLGG